MFPAILGALTIPAGVLFNFSTMDPHMRNAYAEEGNFEIEQQIGLNAHIQSEMPIFLTLRDGDGKGLATAMLPPRGVDRSGEGFQPIVVGPNNTDPYPLHGDAIAKLGERFGLTLDRDRCFPYRRS